MANVRMITTALNNYFVNNKIMIGSEIPTDGNYNVGDIMIKENQVAGEAIGWVCVTGGSPATWSEFGKEPVLEDGSVNMAKLADDVRLKLALIDAVNVSIKSVRSDIDGLQTDVETLTSDVENINTVIEEKVGENIGDLTGLYTEDKSNLVNAINELNTECVNLNGYIEDVEEVAYGNKYDIGVINSDIGDKTNLSTTDKSNLVAAINEVFQSGVDVKNKLVEALASKDVSCSTSDTFDDLISKIESMIVAPSWAANVGLPAAAAEMSVTRRFLTSAVIGTNIYAIGGYNGSATNTNEMYDTITNTWTTKKVLSNSIYGGAAVSCNGSIYHLGGYSYTTSNYMYNPTTNTWTSKTVLPNAKQYSAAVEANGKVYISQGNNTYNIVYDPSTNAWTQLTRNSTTGGNYVSSAYYNGKIYVMGGASYPTYAYAYDIANNTWATIKAIPTGFYRAGQHGMVYKDKIYFMAGTYNSSTSNKILRYDPVANTWELLPITLPIAVYGPATEIVNGKMYCIGGYYNTYMKTNQMLLF